MSFLRCPEMTQSAPDRGGIVDSEARAYAHLHPIGRGRDLAKPTSTRRPAMYDPDFPHGRGDPSPTGDARIAVFCRGVHCTSATYNPGFLHGRPMVAPTGIAGMYVTTVGVGTWQSQRPLDAPQCAAPVFLTGGETPPLRGRRESPFSVGAVIDRPAAWIHKTGRRGRRPLQIQQTSPRHPS